MTALRLMTALPRRAALLLAATLSLSSAPALAEERAAPLESDGGALSVTIENDLLTGTDRDYTSGVRLDYITGKNDLSALGRLIRRQLAAATRAKSWYETYAIGQNIYTPSDIAAPAPQPGERPYAGFLYASFGLSADRGDRLDSFAIDIGVTGDASLAERTQKLVHDVIDAAKPVGWSTQLDEEVAFRILYERKYRRGFGFDVPILGQAVGLEVDALPHANLALGTVDTSAALGATLRLGVDLADDYGPPRVRPAVGAPGFFRADNNFRWYVFAGAEGRVVARNMFLEGNLFDGREGVTIHPVVVDLQVGAAIAFGGVELSYTHVMRSEEYAEQDRWAAFGSLNLRTKF